MDPGAVLDRGEQAAREGRYEDSLQDFIWFHEHALEYEPSLYGVRLSFALASWLALADDYPPALEALKAIRDRKAQVLLDGGGDKSLFHDVETINEKLGELSRTHAIFTELSRRQPQLAKECAAFALEALIAFGDYGLARSYVVEPIAKIEACAARLNFQVDYAAKELTHDPSLPAAFVRVYLRDVNEILAILEGTGELELAQHVRRSAVDLVSSTDLRQSVIEALARRPRPNSA